MSGELDRIEQTIADIAVSETSDEAKRIIERLSQAMEGLRTELLYERLETPDILPDAEVTAFKLKVYKSLKDQRATDLVISYNRTYFEGMKPITRLSMVQALLTIANEQKVTIPDLWRRLLDSRGHF